MSVSFDRERYLALLEKHNAGECNSEEESELLTLSIKGIMEKGLEALMKIPTLYDKVADLEKRVAYLEDYLSIP